MTSGELSKSTYATLVRLAYSRKVNFFTEITDRAFFQDLDKDTQSAIYSFPQINIDTREDLMGIDTLDGDQQFYVIRNEKGDFLVDTQGFNYPRYITELVGFKFKDQEPFEYMDRMIRITNEQIFNAAVQNIVRDLLNQGDFHRSDILEYLHYKLDMAFDITVEKL